VRAQLQAAKVTGSTWRFSATGWKASKAAGTRPGPRGRRHGSTSPIAHFRPHLRIHRQKSIQVGDRIQPGQAVMAVVPLRDVYVEANFKETQLTHVRLGQPTVIKADVYPGRPTVVGSPGSAPARGRASPYSPPKTPRATGSRWFSGFLSGSSSTSPLPPDIPWESGIPWKSRWTPRTGPEKS